MLAKFSEHLMRSFILIQAALAALSSSASAQHLQPRRAPSEIKPDVNGGAKADETNQLIARARERQKRINKHNSDLWGGGSTLFVWAVVRCRRTFGSRIPILRVF
jgi:hypothetical protein